MRKVNVLGSTLILNLVLLACSPTKTAKESSDQKLDSLFKAYYEFKKEINPLEATKAGYNEYNDQLANYISSSYLISLKEKYTSFLSAISAIDTADLSTENLMSMKVMKWDCSIKLEGLNKPLVTVASPIFDLPNLELMPLIQMQSLHLYIPQLASGSSVHPFKTAKDYDDWLRRLEVYLNFLDTAQIKMTEGIRRGVVLPKSLIVKVIPQIETFAKGPVENHLFYQPIVNLPKDLADSEKQRLKESYAAFIKNRLIPAYQRLNDFLKNTYLPAGSETSGISSLPGGPETYEYLLRLSTSTNMSYEEIHQLGLQEVDRIKKEMLVVKDQLGFKGDLKEFINWVRNHPKYRQYKNPEEVIANFDAIRKKVESNLHTVFSAKPKAGFEVRRTEAFREASASAEYVPGSKDATRAGIFYVPIPNVTQYNGFADESLFLHEAIPGHHYQLSLQQENTGIPEFLHPESMSVFVEGWALYAESLGKELGLYEDPIQYFGMLNMEMHRAIRLVVDTGIHGKGWTREQAIKFSMENEADSEAEIISSIERYMATPGQAVSYKIGQLKIRSLREKAEKELGDKFSLPEFHQQVLGSGSLPLFLLEEKIERWIAGVINR